MSAQKYAANLRLESEACFDYLNCFMSFYIFM